MKIRSIEIDNVKSFASPERIPFQDDFNILIGPNAGGKSNILDITIAVLNKFFLKQYNEQDRNTGLRLEQETPFSDTDRIFESFQGNEDRDSTIEIELEVTPEDEENASKIYKNRNEIQSHLDKYDRVRGRGRKLANGKFDFLTEVSEGDCLEYEIINDSLQSDFEEDNKQSFLNYLNIFNLCVLVDRSMDRLDLHPSYFYFSPYRRITGDKNIRLGSDGYQKRLHDYMESTSVESTSAFELALFRLSEKKRQSESESHDLKFDEDQEVKRVREEFSRLGYELEIECKNIYNNEYELIMKKEDWEYRIDQLSSGEAEIVNFLLGILSTNIRNGLIVIDEPELHLHPRWQSVLMNLLTTLEEKTGNQFIFTTHSPQFITEDTISNTIRVYKDNSESSRTTMINNEDFEEFNLRDLIQIINSKNNKRIFFADHIILVEGISDRMVFHTLLEHLLEEEEENQPWLIETLEVDGKYNFNKYSRFLDEFGVSYSIIADRDYADQLDSDLAQQLFITDHKKIDNKVLKDKGSNDADRLSKQLDDAIQSGDLEDLEDVKETWDYIRGRKTRFKEELSQDEQGKWEEFNQKKREEDIYLLPDGEIEDHLPENVNSKREVIEFTNSDDFITWMDSDINSEKSEPLKNILESILSSEIN